ncbi:MAG: radical SAM protein [Deltaproteobacteria bacterium]|nr:radical SAM protein [Deltaproteobacteria bacterium]MCB2186301.1 radical SAM protein [Deltaproteobacteria bacterium]
MLRPQDFFLQWHLTQRCNLACRHCYQEPSTTPEITQAEAREIMDEAVEMLEDWRQAYGLDLSASVNLTGGEPFLRDDLFPIIADLRARGFEVFLLTNGLLVDAAAARRLADLGVAGVQVSLEGPAAVHEAVRGPGSHAAALAGVANLVDSRLPVTLNVTLSAHNAAAMPELVDLARSLGVARLGYSRLVPVGRGRDMLAAALSREELRELYARLGELAPPGLDLVTGDPVAAQAKLPPPPEDLGDTPLGGCAAGVSGLTIMHDGTLLPCRRLPLPLGNLRTDSLREIWAASPLLHALRDRSRYAEPCRSCARWAVCRGCRAIAHAHSGAATGGDPGCFLGA